MDQVNGRNEGLVDLGAVEKGCSVDALAHLSRLDPIELRPGSVPRIGRFVEAIDACHWPNVSRRDSNVQAPPN